MDQDERPAPSPQHKPAIRTMKSDTDALLQNTRRSVADFVRRDSALGPNALSSESFGGRRRIIFIFSAAALLLGLFGIAALVFLRQKSATPPEAPPPQETLPVFFAPEKTQTIRAKFSDRAQFLGLLTEIARSEGPPNTFTQTIARIQDGPQPERLMRIEDLFALLGAALPQPLASAFDSAPMMFVYYGQGAGRFGMVARARDPERAFAELLKQESSLATDLQPLFFGETALTPIAQFGDMTRRNIDWRFQSLSTTTDLGIGYGVFPAKRLILITTGKDAMEALIDRLLSQ